MNVLRRAAAPVRAPAKRVVGRYRNRLEELIHAVKNELVGRMDDLDERMEDLGDVVKGSHEAIGDQLAIQSATLRALETELERLQDLTRSAGEHTTVSDR